MVIGASRKNFLADAVVGADPSPRSPSPRSPSHRSPSHRSPSHRDDASVALTALLAHQPIWAFRTHTARPHRTARSRWRCDSNDHRYWAGDS
jgi:dihydropteroate synthase